MKYFSYLNSAVDILRTYNGQQPFHLFIKTFFKQNKKYGSSDRKQITQLCYACLRLGKSLSNHPLDVKIMTGYFLSVSQSSDLLEQVKPEWTSLVQLSFKEKCKLLNIAEEDLHLFPSADQISDGIDKNDFVLSHLAQPDVFLRTRPGQFEQVVKKLAAAGIPCSYPARDCIALANTARIDAVIDINREAVVQDFNSQRVGDLLLLPAFNHLPVTWDCCAASGGKSIMAKDLLGNIALTVTDVRETVLINLKKRFSEAGITAYKTLLADLSIPVKNNNPGLFELIIADVPCTGSGTWGRTPERLSFFDTGEIEKYSRLQHKIVQNVLPQLKKNGYFLYITCSVFAKENEEIISSIERTGLQLIRKEIFKGYHIKADTMFAALLKKTI